MKLPSFTWLRHPSGATPDEISEVEECIEKVFPDDYREFIHVCAGGIPTTMTDFDFAEPDGTRFTGVLGVFLSYKRNDEYNLLATVASLSGRFSPGLIPIIEDPGGNFICLDYRYSATPSICFWRHDRAGETNEMSYVAASFTQFLDLLHDPPSDEELDD